MENYLTARPKKGTSGPWKQIPVGRGVQMVIGRCWSELLERVGFFLIFRVY